MSWTVTWIANIADTTDQQTFDSTDTNITLTAGKTYWVSVAVSDTAAEAAGDPSSVGTSDAAAAFTKASGFAFQTNRNLSWWYYKPGSTLTGKTLRVVFDDAGTGCIAHLISIDESTADPPYVDANTKTATDTDTDVSATPDALQAGSLLLAAAYSGETAAQTVSGTNWGNITSASSSHNTPNGRLQLAKNDSGTASAVTFTGSASTLRGLVVIEVEAGEVTTNIPAITKFYRQMRAS